MCEFLKSALIGFTIIMQCKYPDTPCIKNIDSIRFHSFLVGRVPRKKTGPDYKYTEVVRKQDERRKLNPYVCDQCARVSTVNQLNFTSDLILRF